MSTHVRCVAGSSTHTGLDRSEPRALKAPLRGALARLAVSQAGGSSGRDRPGEGEPWCLGDLQRCGRAALGEGGGGQPGQAGPGGCGGRGPAGSSTNEPSLPAADRGLLGEESLRGSAEPGSLHTALSMATGQAGGRMCQLAGSVGAAVCRQLVRRTKPGPAVLSPAWSLTCTHHGFTGKLRGSGLCPTS